MHLAGLIGRTQERDGMLHFRHGTGRQPDKSGRAVNADANLRNSKVASEHQDCVCLVNDLHEKFLDNN